MRHEDAPDINNPKIRKGALECDKLMKEVLSGGYIVPPVPAPDSETKEVGDQGYERQELRKKTICSRIC